MVRETIWNSNQTQEHVQPNPNLLKKKNSIATYHVVGKLIRTSAGFRGAPIYPFPGLLLAAFNYFASAVAWAGLEAMWPAVVVEKNGTSPWFFRQLLKFYVVCTNGSKHLNTWFRTKFVPCSIVCQFQVRLRFKIKLTTLLQLQWFISSWSRKWVKGKSTGWLQGYKHYH